MKLFEIVTTITLIAGVFIGTSVYAETAYYHRDLHDCMKEASQQICEAKLK